MLTLAEANRIIEAILARGAELQCRPLSVVVVLLWLLLLSVVLLWLLWLSMLLLELLLLSAVVVLLDVDVSVLVDVEVSVLVDVSLLLLEVVAVLLRLLSDATVLPLVVAVPSCALP